MNHRKGQAEEISGNTSRIWNGIFVKMLFINLMISFATNMMNQLAPMYSYDLSGSNVLAGTTASIFALTCLIFKFVSAPALDSLNKKLILLGASAVMACAFVGYAFSYTVSMLIAFRLVQGAGQAFVTTGCLIIATNSLPNKKMATGIAYFSMTTAVCGAIAPALSLKLIDLIGYHYTFGILAAMMFLVILSFAFLKLEHKPVRKFRITLHSVIAKEAVLPAAILLIISLASSMPRAFLAISTRDTIGSDIGYFFTVSAIVMIFSRPITGRITDKIGIVKVMIPMIILTAASFVMIGFAATLPMYLAAAVVQAIGMGSIMPSIQATIMKSVPPDRRGSASSTTYIAADIGTLIGPAAGGYIIDRAGYSLTWYYTVIPLIVGLAAVILFRRRLQRLDANEETRVPGILQELSD